MNDKTAPKARKTPEEFRKNVENGIGTVPKPSIDENANMLFSNLLVDFYASLEKHRPMAEVVLEKAKADNRVDEGVTADDVMIQVAASAILIGMVGHLENDSKDMGYCLAMVEHALLNSVRKNYKLKNREPQTSSTPNTKIH